MHSGVGRFTTRTASLGTTIACLLAFTFLVASATRAPAQATITSQATVTYTQGDRGKVTGYILMRKGDDMLVRDETTKQLSLVSITAATKITSPTGFLSLDTKAQAPTTLIPGLLIKVKGAGGVRGNLVADDISFRQSALRVATQIAAGEVELRAQQRQTAAAAAANRENIADAKERARDSIDALSRSVNARISNLDDYDVKAQATVFFAPGSSLLNDEMKRQLDALFARSQGVEGFTIEITGFADTTGSAEANQAISGARARAVAAYLIEAHAVPPRRIATPSGLGTSRPVASNGTSGGRALNRRAEVRLLINRGLHPAVSR